MPALVCMRKKSQRGLTKNISSLVIFRLSFDATARCAEDTAAATADCAPAASEPTPSAVAVPVKIDLRSIPLSLVSFMGCLLRGRVRPAARRSEATVALLKYASQEGAFEGRADASQTEPRA